MNRSMVHWLSDSKEIPQEMVILLALQGRKLGKFS